MIHSSHGLKIYHHRAHLWLVIFALLIPLFLLFYYGALNELEIHALLIGLSLSLGRLLTAYLLSLVVGVGLAVSLGQTRLGGALLPLFDIMQNVPSFALIPVFGLLMGYTNLMAVTFAATSIVWPILFYVLSATRLARTDLNDAATIFGAVGWKRVWYYLVPLSFPAIITGSIVGLSIGWEAIIGIEIIGFRSGIGVFLNQASQAGANQALIAGIGVILFLVFVMNRAIWSPLLKQAQNYAE